MSWPNVAFGDLAVFLSGNAWSAPKFNSDCLGVPVIRIQNVSTSDSTFLYWNEPFDNRFLINKGDMLLTLSGSFRTTIWDGPQALLNQRIVKIVPSPRLDSQYLLHFLSRKLGDIERMGRHALVNNVSLADLKAMPIPLPPLDEQRRIAAILDQAEDLRAKRRAAIALLDQLPQAIFLEMFGDPAKNPFAWSKRKLKELGKVTTGRTPPGSETGMYGGTIPFITPGDLGSGDRAKRTLTDAGARSVPNVRKGAAMVCCIGATIGKMDIAPSVSTFNQQINAVEWGDRVDDEYGIECLRFFKDQIARDGASTTLPILKKSLFEEITIPLPPLEFQQNFAARTGSIQRAKAANLTALTEIEALAASLQARAFSNEPAQSKEVLTL